MEANVIKYTLSCRSGESRAAEIFEDLSRTLSVPPYLPFKEVARADQLKLSVPAFMRYFGTWDDPLQGQGAYMSSFRRKGGDISFYLYGSDDPDFDPARAMAARYGETFDVLRKGRSAGCGEAKAYVAAPEEGVAELRRVSPKPRPDETKVILARAYKEYMKGLWKDDRESGLKLAASYVRECFPDRKAVADEWESRHLHHPEYNPVVGLLEVEHIANYLATDILTSRYGNTPEEMKTFIGGMTAAQLDDFTKETLWAARSILPSVSADFMKEQLAVWTDIEPSDGLRRTDISRIVDDYYCIDNKSDQGCWFRLMDDSIRLCECQSHIDMWGDFDRPQDYPVKLTDLDALCLRLRRMVDEFGVSGEMDSIAMCSINGMELARVSVVDGSLKLEFKDRNIPLPLFIEPKDLSVREIRAVHEYVSDTLDAIAYQRCCKGMEYHNKVYLSVVETVAPLMGGRDPEGTRRADNLDRTPFRGSTVETFVSVPSHIVDALTGKYLDEYSVKLADGRKVDFFDMSSSELRAVGRMASATAAGREERKRSMHRTKRKHNKSIS